MGVVKGCFLGAGRSQGAKEPRGPGPDRAVSGLCGSKKEYRLATLPDKVFSGLQLMCLMFVGFKRFAPELDSGMDLDEPFSAALEMFQAGGER